MMSREERIEWLEMLLKSTVSVIRCGLPGVGRITISIDLDDCEYTYESEGNVG